MSIEEITAFSQAREEMFEIAKTVSRNLGLYYQTYENIVSIYVSDWVNKGYDGKTLELVSSYCLRQNIHTLESMNVVIQKFFKLGLVSMQSIEQYISSILAADEEIKQVLDALGLVRSVSSYDRDLYKIWTTNWNFSLGAILQVAEISKGKANAFAYMNKILATLNETGKKTESEVAGYLKKLPKTISSNSDTKSKFNYEQREYTNTELTAVFDSLDDVEF
jgi:hypothetical protein